jgi:hypothetical protein
MSPRHGAGVVAIAIFSMLLLMTTTDAFFLLRTRFPLGYWVGKWARTYSSWLLFFSFVLGAMLGHFFTKPYILDWPLRLNLP